MDKLKAYNDLCKEVEVWEIRLDDLESERLMIIRKMSRPPQTKLCANYDGMPGAGMAVIDFPEEFARVQRIDYRIEVAKDILSLKREAKRRMEKAINEMSTLEYRVAVMRDSERKPLHKIAEELGYSYEWIRKISSRTKRIRIS